MIIRDEAAKLLESKDLDTEGRMSYEEFMGEQTKAERLFKLMDKDGDGYVTKNVSLCLLHIALTAFGPIKHG